MFRSVALSLVLSLVFAGYALAGGCPSECLSQHGVMREFGINVPKTNVIYNAKGDELIEELPPLRVWLNCPQGECKELSLLADVEVRTVKLVQPAVAVYGANSNDVAVIQPNGQRFIVHFGKMDKNGKCRGYIFSAEGYKEPIYGISYVHDMKN